MSKKINIAVVGLGFGGCFANIYAKHPNVGIVTVSDFISDRTEWLRKSHDNVRVATFEEILADNTIDAVHVCTGIPQHASQCIQVLDAGKHCACAVPMAVSLQEIEDILAAVERSGKNYMMMETQLYGGPFFLAEEMLDTGVFGRIQHMRGIHYQPMESWPGYWMGLPPMHYATHIIAPMAGLARERIVSVSCMGSGTMDAKYHTQYGNPFPIESGNVMFANGVTGEIARGLFECSAITTESFNVYGSLASFYHENGQDCILERFTDHSVYDHFGRVKRSAVFPNRCDLLPRELWGFTTTSGDKRDGESEEDFVRTLKHANLNVHAGSHPHLCHEFVSSIIENRKPKYAERFAANAVAAGVLAHESAMKGGAVMLLPF